MGRGVPAGILDRALFEEALDAYWVAANPVDAPRRADEHERAVYLGERKVQQQFGRSTALMSEAEEDELAPAMRRYSGFKKSWTLETVLERVRLVKVSWGAEADEHLNYLYEFMLLRVVAQEWAFDIRTAKRLFVHASRNDAAARRRRARNGPSRCTVSLRQRSGSAGLPPILTERRYLSKWSARL